MLLEWWSAFQHPLIMGLLHVPGGAAEGDAVLSAGARHTLHPEQHTHVDERARAERHTALTCMSTMHDTYLASAPRHARHPSDSHRTASAEA